MSYCTWHKVSPFTLSWVGGGTDNPEDPNASAPGAAVSALQSVMTGLNTWSVDYNVNGDLSGLSGQAATMYVQNMPCMADGSMPGGVLAISYIALTTGEWLATDNTNRYISTSIYNVYSSFSDAVSDFANYITNQDGRNQDRAGLDISDSESLLYRISWGTLSN